jgi:hypothetical protein
VPTPTRLHHGSRVHPTSTTPARSSDCCRDTATPSPTRRLGHGCAHPTATPTSRALLAPTPTLAGRLRVAFLVATPRRHATATPATRSRDGGDTTTPTSPLRFDLHCTPTPTTARALARARPTPSPTLRCLCFDLPTPTPTCLNSSCHGTSCARTFSCNYGTDAFRTERDGPHRRFPFRAELTNADVLVGDVHLPVLVAVGLCPRLGFARRPTCAAAEEERLHLRRRLLRLSLFWSGDRRGARERSRKDRSTDTRRVSSRFTEVGQSIVIKTHGALSRVSMRVWQVKKTKSGLARASGYVAARSSDV